MDLRKLKFKTPLKKGDGSMYTLECLLCKKEFQIYESHYRRGIGKFCSTKCGNKGRRSYKRENHPLWKGGRIKRQGYWYLYIGKQKYIAEHRIVMEKHLGRQLSSLETVHHINHNPSDNRIANLQLFATRGKHIKFAHPEIMKELISANKKRAKKIRDQRLKFECQICKKVLYFPTFRFLKRKYCSKKCAWIAFKGEHHSPKTQIKKGAIPWNKCIKMPQIERKKFICLLCQKVLYLLPGRFKGRRFCSVKCAKIYFYNKTR